MPLKILAMIIGIHILIKLGYFFSLLPALELVLLFGYLIGFAGSINVVVATFYIILLIKELLGG